MKNKHSEKPEPDMITVFVGTWNMGNNVNVLTLMFNTILMNHKVQNFSTNPQETPVLHTTSTPGFSVKDKARPETTRQITSRMTSTSSGPRRTLWGRGSGHTH